MPVDRGARANYPMVGEAKTVLKRTERTMFTIGFFFLCGLVSVYLVGTSGPSFYGR